MAVMLNNVLESTAQAVTRWAEKWFPDASFFAALAVVVVALGAWAAGERAMQVGIAWGWILELNSLYDANGYGRPFGLCAGSCTPCCGVDR